MQTIESLQAETAALNEVNERLLTIMEGMRERNAETELELHHLMFQVWFEKTFKLEPVRDENGYYQPFWDQKRFEAFRGAMLMMKDLKIDD